LDLSNITFEARDIINDSLSYEQKATVSSNNANYDLIIAIDVIHDLSHPEKALRNIFSALKLDGIFFMQEISASAQLEKNLSKPLAPLLYSISTMYCMTTSLGLGGVGFGTMYGQENFIKLLNSVGFISISTQSAPPLGMQTNYICYKSKSKL